MSVTDIWGEEPVSVTDTGSSPQNGTCPNMPIGCRRRDDAIFDDATSPPDVYSIAVMTKSSSKVLGRFPTIKSITGR